MADATAAAMTLKAALAAAAVTAAAPASVGNDDSGFVFFWTSKGPLGAVLFSGYGPGPSKIDTLDWFLARIINPDINFDLTNQ